MRKDVGRGPVKAVSRIPGILTKSAILAVLTLVVFLILNLAAHLAFLAIRADRTDLLRGAYFIPPNSPEGLALLREIMQTEDNDLIRSLAVEDPGIRPHPVLHFTNGPSRGHYRVGVEGIRYEPGWTDEIVNEWLAEAAKTDYVFGGSTTFGQGVTGRHTLVAQMNRARTHGRYLNFAVLAHDSLRETDLLLHLIRKGYRPGKIVFVDGLNDLITFCESPFSAHEKPRMQALLMDRGQVPLIYGYPKRNNMLSAFAFAFPVVQLVNRLIAESIGQSTYGSGYSELDEMDWPRMMYFYEKWERLQVVRAREIAEDWTRYYKSHIEFVRALETSFGFKADFVYQPIGLLENEHPFLRPAFLESSAREIFTVFDEVVREAIRSGQIDMIDCSRVISNARQVSVAYLDATHYSPLGNEILARCIEENIRIGE